LQTPGHEKYRFGPSFQAASRNGLRDTDGKCASVCAAAPGTITEPFGTVPAIASYSKLTKEEPMKRFALSTAAVLMMLLPATAGGGTQDEWRLLESSETIQGHILPAGTRVSLDNVGNLGICFLGRDTELEGHLCRGAGHNYMTGFHSNGRLRLCWLKEPETIQGVPCRRATFFNDAFGPTVGVMFHADGSLAGCKLDRDFTVDRREFRSGERIEFSRNGNLR